MKITSFWSICVPRSNPRCRRIGNSFASFCVRSRPRIKEVGEKEKK